MQFPCCSAWCLRNRQSFCLIYHISFVINSVHIDIYEVCTLWLDGFHRQKYHSPSHPFPTIWYLKRDIFRYINDIFAYLLIILVYYIKCEETSSIRLTIRCCSSYGGSGTKYAFTVFVANSFCLVLPSDLSSITDCTV